MFSKIVFVLFSVVVSYSMAEVKAPGTIVPSMCGQNQIKQNAAGVSTVCVVTVVGKSSDYLSVTVSGGITAGEYVYEHTKRKTAVAECQTTAKGMACLKTYSLVARVGAQGQFSPLGGSLETVSVYTVGGKTLQGKFLGNDFSTKNMQIVFQTM